MSEWRKYDGERDKEFHDIELKNGKVIRNVYPNGYAWHDDKGNRYTDEDVAYIKPIGFPDIVDLGL